MMLVAFIKAFGWVRAHKPLIDEQQGKQLKMQEETIVMQQEQLALQKEQLRMLRENFEMLSRLQNDLIASGAIQLPEKSGLNGAVRSDAQRKVDAPIAPDPGGSE
jgi:hypothetical protein